MKPKPRRWIERMELKCADTFHQERLGEFGFEAYVTQALYWKRAPDEDGYRLEMDRSLFAEVCKRLAREAKV